MRLNRTLQDSIDLKEKILSSTGLLVLINQATDAIIRCFRNDGKVFFCGNGGSAADAQHLAAEFSGRFYYDRPPLFAEALHVNTSYITAVGNDYGYEEIYSRLLKAKGAQGDVLVALSTSGNSPNIIRAIQVAREKGMIVIGFTGESGGEMRDICNYLINVPSTDTPRIQEAHITIGHAICEEVEAMIFPK